MDVNVNSTPERRNPCRISAKKRQRMDQLAEALKQHKGLPPPASSHQGYRRVPETPPPTGESYITPDPSDSESDLDDSPLQIQTGHARHGYTWDRIRGHVYRCHREPDGCRCQPTQCRLWLRREQNFSNPPWIWASLLAFMYGTILVSQRTGLASHTRWD